LARNWPPAFKEWNTRSVRDAFFASPRFPRLLNPDSIKETISNGVSGGVLAYLGKTADDKYSPFYYEKPISVNDIEISEDMFILKKEDADAYKNAQIAKPVSIVQPDTQEDGYRSGGTPHKKHREDNSIPYITKPTEDTSGTDVVTPSSESIHEVKWNGEIPHQKWTNFYMKVLTKLASDSVLKLTLNVEVLNEKGISKQKLEEIKIALRELGLSDDLIFD
ncbi:MAG: AAA family ATPase, partial [Candidatus Thermoplasmatota archaeon]|nr:AAA family ATPase [Candidatus Thermoplasmatota archaeon]